MLHLINTGLVQRLMPTHLIVSRLTISNVTIKKTLANRLVLQANKALLSRVLPAPIESGFNRKAKSHDKTTRRSMLRVEITEQITNKAEKEQAREMAEAVEEKRIPDTQERVLDTPEQWSQQAGQDPQPACRPVRPLAIPRIV
jgi:hypothetical protein